MDLNYWRLIYHISDVCGGIDSLHSFAFFVFLFCFSKWVEVIFSQIVLTDGAYGGLIMPYLTICIRPCYCDGLLMTWPTYLLASISRSMSCSCVPVSVCVCVLSYRKRVFEHKEILCSTRTKEYRAYQQRINSIESKPHVHAACAEATYSRCDIRYLSRKWRSDPFQHFSHVKLFEEVEIRAFPFCDFFSPISWFHLPTPISQDIQAVFLDLRD